MAAIRVYNETADVFESTKKEAGAVDVLILVLVILILLAVTGHLKL